MDAYQIIMLCIMITGVLGGLIGWIMRLQRRLLQAEFKIAAIESGHDDLNDRLDRLEHSLISIDKKLGELIAGLRGAGVYQGISHAE